MSGEMKVNILIRGLFGLFSDCEFGLVAALLAVAQANDADLSLPEGLD